MKHATIVVLALSVTFAACGKKDGGGASESDAPKMTVVESDWVVKNLKTVAPMVNLSMKVPKDAKLEKNGNGGVDITISPFYMLTVSTLAVANLAEAMKGDKSLTIDNKSSYINGKALLDETNGFIYTMQMKDEENGNKYQPEVHFAYYVEKDGAFYSILDQKPMSAFSTPGSAYTEAMAKQVYGIVKGSAKAN